MAGKGNSSTHSRTVLIFVNLILSLALPTAEGSTQLQVFSAFDAGPLSGANRLRGCNSAGQETAE